MRAVAILVTLTAACATERDRGGAPSEGVHQDGVHHGALGRELGWDLAACRDCHGEDLGGGTSGVSCKDCHEDSPSGCTTCHDESTGAHQAHLGPAEVPCAECHTVPARWDDPDHLDGVARVVLGALAARDVTPPRRTEPPSYDPATATCSSVYCHGGTLGDTAATAPAPGWYDTGVARCGSCHGAPPDDHASPRCGSCHQAGAVAHLDGVLDVGDGCSGCHGDATSPAPPRGLDGETSPQALSVGVHRAHLESSTLRGPIPCADCHVVPTTLGALGHIDSAEPAEMIPAVGWDRPSASCTNYCHGDATPVWNRPGQGEAACGTCHGLPPAGLHDPTWTIDLCTTCHPSVDDIGAIVFTAPGTTEHLDGSVTLR